MSFFETREAAKLRLEFLVIGGGIAGLATAYALCQAGHRVRVIEKRGIDAPGGPIRVAPNLSKILLKWAGEEALAKCSIRCDTTLFQDLTSGDLIGPFSWSASVLQETGGDFLLMLHNDCHRLLYDLAKAAGARIDFNTSVTAIYPGTDEFPEPKVTLSTGEVVCADLVVGADGVNGMVRDIVVEQSDSLKFSGITAYSGTVMVSDMLQDPELRQYAESNTWSIFMGSRRTVAGHLTREGQQFGIHIHEQDDPNEGSVVDDWTDTIVPDSLDCAQYAPKIRRLIAMAPRLVKARFMQPQPDSSEEWVDETGRILLLGDAAHPWMPGGVHGPAMAVEDAAVLGTLFSHLKTRDQIGLLVDAYQELRRTRCETVVNSEIDSCNLVIMPPGPMRDKRNEILAISQPDDWDEESLRKQFEEYGYIFAYDACEAAEEWWLDWGRLADIQQGYFDLHLANVGFHTL